MCSLTKVIRAAGWVGALAAVIGFAPGCDRIFTDVDSVALQIGADGDAASAEDVDGGPEPVDADGGPVTTDTHTSSGADGSDTIVRRDARDAGRDTSTHPPDVRPDIDTGPAYGCFEMTSCAYIQCPDYKTGCIAGTVNSGTMSEARKAGTLIGCLKNKRCDYYGEPTCVRNECGGAASVCLGKKPTWIGLRCSEVLDCRRHCSLGDTSCENECVSRAGFTARNQYRALQNCARNNCSSGPDPVDECLRKNCKKQFEKCMDCP